MARKKRKISRRSAESFRAAARPAQFHGERDAWLLPSLGALALVLAWLAALGGAVTDGPVDSRYVFGHDTLTLYGVFRDLFLDDGYPVSGWRYGRAPLYFPDFTFQWALFLLGFDLGVALLFLALVQVALAAAGWILVCDFVYGKSPIRRAAVLLLHAAGFLHLAWLDSALFMLQITVVWHYGTWACAPWLLWLSMRVLSAPPDRAPSPANLAALAAAATVVAASDLLIVPWILAPAAAAAMLFARPQVAGFFILAVGAGIAAGFALAAAVPIVHTEAAVNFHFDRIGRHLRTLLFYLTRISAYDPLEFLLLPAFAVALLWRLAGEFGPGQKSGRKAEGAFCPRRFILAVMPLSAAATVAGIGVNGLGELNYLHPVQDLRYALPILFFPLFIGWALLPLPAPKFPARKAVLSACAAACLLSMPPALKIDFAAMDPFETPFQKCLAENAKRRGWTGVIAPAAYVLPMFLNPDTGLKNYINAVVPFGGASGERAFHANNLIANWRRMSGEFQVVAVNAHQGRLFIRPPIRGEEGCPAADPACVQTHAANGVPFHDQIVRAAFGDPAEIVECAGVGLYHYDPPLRFEFSENPDGQVIGRKF